MPRFLVEHPTVEPFDPEAVTPTARAIKGACSADAYWVRTLVAPAARRMYCEWEAKDAQAVLDALGAAGKVAPELPVAGIYEITMQVSGEDFR